MGARTRTVVAAVVSVETPYRDFLAFWQRARHAPRAEQRRLWDELYVARHPALMEHYDRDFGRLGSLDDALGRFDSVVGQLDARFHELQIDARAREVAELLDAPEAPRAIALVGVFTADAWSDDLDGTPVAFFALERPQSRVVATHELTHASHRVARDEYWGVEPGLILLAEGIAITATTRLHPDARPEEHFTVEDFSAWRAEREASWRPSVHALLEVLDRPELAALQRFFWPDWGRDDRDVPERVGYLIAARLMDALLARHDLATVVRWRADRALPEVRDALASLTA